MLAFEPGMEILPSNTRLSRYPKARVVRALREQGWGAAKKARLPRLERADIHVTYLPPPRRKKDRTRSPRRGWTTATRSRSQARR